MTASILDSIKKQLGLDATYTAFDSDILLLINSAFSTLNQLGIGPPNGLYIENSLTTWDAFIGTDARLNSVREYVYISVRLIFDPPQTGYLVEAFNKKLEELTFRLNVVREGDKWAAPISTLSVDSTTTYIIDGGS